MKDTLISFQTGKLAKEKGFDLECLYFYTKPNSKIFGIDERGRAYSIKNTPRKLYKCGEQAALNIKNVFLAPTQSLLQCWLREVHKIHIQIAMHEFNKWCFGLQKIDKPIKNYPKIAQNNIWNIRDYSSYEEALEQGLLTALQLIK